MIKYNKYVINTFKKSEDEAFKFNNGIVNIDFFILGILKTNNSIKKILNKNNISYENYIEKMKINNKTENKYISYSADLKRILDLACDTSNRYSSEEIKLEHIIITMIDKNIGLKILKSLNLNVEEFYKNIIKLLSKDKNLLIYELGTNLTALAKNNKLSNAIGRENEINKLIEILARKNKNNPILIGDAGVGKTAIVEELANMIVKNKVPPFLKNKAIISLNIASIISGTKYRGEFEEKLIKILKECENSSDIILFIDEIHNIVGAGGAEGAIDASNILKPILARGTIKIIGATTIEEYKKYITKDKALDRRFQKIIIKEPNIDETCFILKKIKNEYEEFHNVKISENLIRKIVELSNKYIFDRKNPDKSIDILDEVCAATSIFEISKISNNINNKLTKILSKKSKAIKDENYKDALKYREEEQKLKNILNNKISKKEVSIETIINILESKCNSKIYDIEQNNFYNYLKESLKSKIIGQDDNIDKFIKALNFTQNKKDNLPISFFISGPSGIGKTFFVNEIANSMNRNLIKLNMNEFSSEISVSRIMGSPQGYVGYDDNNTIFEELKLNPNSIILIDNIDKAHYTMINIISNILENGILKNSKNEIINFKNSIIIITSTSNEKINIGYLNNTNHSEEGLSNEFINKVNYSINFNKLNENNIKEIINKKLNSLNENYSTNVKLSNVDIKNIINESCYKTNGAKNIDKILKKYIENSFIYSTTL